MTETRLHIALPPPFSFAHTVSAARFYSVLGARAPGGAYRRVLRVGEALALAEFAPEGEHGVSVRLLAASSPVDDAAFAARARWMLHPELDLAPFYALAASDPDLARLIGPLAGLRAFRLDSAFESLAITIIEQQIALTMAQAAERWLIQTYGDLEYAGERYYAFPTPARLASLTTADLTPLKITFIRMERLLNVARLVASGALDLEARVAVPDALYHAMLALPGVGHWTAAWALIRASGQFRYFGRADVALRAAANQHFAGQPGRMDGATMDALFARFGDAAGLAAFYLIIRYAHDKVKL